MVLMDRTTSTISTFSLHAVRAAAVHSSQRMRLNVRFVMRNLPVKNEYKAFIAGIKKPIEFDLEF